jgi:hypothetical protein
MKHHCEFKNCPNEAADVFFYDNGYAFYACLLHIRLLWKKLLPKQKRASEIQEQIHDSIQSARETGKL